jgi:hypothetical protein
MGTGVSESKKGVSRGIIALAIAGVLGAGGWYYMSQGPKVAAGASTPSFKAPAGAAAPASAKKNPPASKPSLDAPKPVALPTPAPKPPAAPASDPLGPEYLDTVNGFTVRLPRGWQIRTFTGDVWILDCGDPSEGMISIGFSRCPTSVSVDNLLPETMARRIRRNPGTTLQEIGRETIAEREALWAKFTGPLHMSNASPRMMRIHYLIPLQDGRALELRAAAPPARFHLMLPLMKQSLATFRLRD